MVNTYVHDDEWMNVTVVCGCGGDMALDVDWRNTWHFDQKCVQLCFKVAELDRLMNHDFRHNDANDT